MINAIQFSSVGEFLAMGGYAFHVWSVYGMFLAFLALNLWLPVARRRRFMRQEKSRLARRAARPGATGEPVASASHHPPARSESRPRPAASHLGGAS